MEIINEIKIPNLVNPFAGYLLNLQKTKKKVNPVQEIANTYYRMKGWENMGKSFYVGKNGYSKVCLEAKELYTVLNKNLDDCIWALDRMKYLADKGGFDWSIRTCMKHKKL